VNQKVVAEGLTRIHEVFIDVSGDLIVDPE
jgi:hypothetical protein